MINNHCDPLNNHHKNSYKIESGHIMSRLMTPITYNQNFGINCGHKSTITYIQYLWDESGYLGRLQIEPSMHHNCQKSQEVTRMVTLIVYAIQSHMQTKWVTMNEQTTKWMNEWFSKLSGSHVCVWGLTHLRSPVPHRLQPGSSPESVGWGPLD